MILLASGERRKSSKTFAVSGSFAPDAKKAWMTVGGMMLITMSIASAFTFVGKGRQSFSQRLGLVSGLLSLAFGMLLVYQIGFAGGLFTSHPHWTPR
jgi:uncharacterized membrane protein HdeD (DUF308 family)